MRARILCGLALGVGACLLLVGNAFAFGVGSSLSVNGGSGLVNIDVGQNANAYGHTHYDATAFGFEFPFTAHVSQAYPYLTFIYTPSIVGGTNIPSGRWVVGFNHLLAQHGWKTVPYNAITFNAATTVAGQWDIDVASVSQVTGCQAGTDGPIVHGTGDVDGIISTSSNSYVTINATEPLTAC